MKVTVELEEIDFNFIHDVIVSVTGNSATDDEIKKTWNELPEDIQSIAIQWGCNDTVFRDNLYMYLFEKNQE